MTDRPLPADLVAERAVLGAILLDREAIVSIADWLTPEDFSINKYGTMYAAALACVQRREPPDIPNVASELRRRNELDAVGGVSFLGDLAAEVPTAVHIEFYARSVERAALARRLIEAGGTISAIGYDEQRPLDEVEADAQQQLVTALRRSSAVRAAPLAESLNAIYRELADGVAPGVPTRLADYDALAGGLHASDLLVLAGRPGMGKTAFACQLAYNVAQQGRRVLVLSLEMSRKQLGQRLLALHSGVSIQAIREQRLSDRQRERLVDAFGAMSELPIHIDDCEVAGAKTLAAIRLSVLRYAAEYGRPDLIIVDFLQLIIGPQDYKGNRVQEVSAISRGLKALAKELDCPVLALSQLSRAVESRVSKVPQLSDLRDSGDIEAAADQVLFLYREAYYEPQSPNQNMAELHIAKHRNGPTGIIPLAFQPETTRFGNLDMLRASP